MQLFVGIVTLLVALSISGVAAYFSVVGLGALFAAAFVPVLIMGASLEVGKLVAAGWLHANWRNPRVNFLHKTYLTTAIAALMLITALGIYGFLAKGHLDQEAPIAGVTLQIEQKEAMIRQAEEEIVRLEARQDQLDEAVDVMFRNDQATKGTALREKQMPEREEIKAGIEAEISDINRLTEEVRVLKTQVNDVEAKLGPVKFVAQLFGWQDSMAAVQMVILIIMFAFDPLAVIMVISATISIGDWASRRKSPKNNVETPVVDGTTSLDQTTPLADQGGVDLDGAVVMERDAARAETEKLRVSLDETIRHLRETQVALEASEINHAQQIAAMTEQRAEVETLVVQLQDEMLLLRESNKAADRTAAETREEAKRLNERLSQLTSRGDKEVLLDILERKPEFLQEVIDAVSAEIAIANSVTTTSGLGWPDNTFLKKK